jgi:hypothetical protein
MIHKSIIYVSYQEIAPTGRLLYTCALSWLRVQRNMAGSSGTVVTAAVWVGVWWFCFANARANARTLSLFKPYFKEWSSTVYNAYFFININLFNCSCNYICYNCICIVIIVCSVSFIVCVVLCAVFLFECGVLFCVLRLIVVPLSPGRNRICSLNK